MLPAQGRFFLFLALVFAVHWALRGRAARKVWLLAVSYAFYALLDGWFLSLVLVSTGVDWFAARGIARSSRAPVRRRWMLASLVTNLGLLATFKYADFFVSSVAEVVRWFGFHASTASLGLLLPIGISFYTFQTLSYTLDVYRGRQAPAQRFVDFALFVAFFPQLAAGPIVRASEFLPQLAGDRRLGVSAPLRPALVALLVGFVQKALIADRLGPLAAGFLETPSALDSAAAWCAAAAYVLHVYLDFAGYSAMAIGCAGLLGLRLPMNFDYPLLAPGLKSFWRRWHISLGRWFLDYVYLPLGGRAGGWLTARNLLLTFGLCGLWHGAAWTFVAWGVACGGFLVLERTLLTPSLSRAPRALGVLWVNATFILCMCAFGARDFRHLAAILERLTWPAFDTALVSAPLALWGSVAAIYAGMVATRVLRFDERATRGSSLVWSFTYGALWALVLPWAPLELQPFVYVRF